MSFSPADDCARITCQDRPSRSCASPCAWLARPSGIVFAVLTFSWDSSPCLTPACAIGARACADLPRLLGQFQELFHQETGDADPVLILNREFLSDNVIRLLRDAHQRAAENGRTLITPMDLLISLFTASNSIVAECFESIGVTAAKLTELAVMAEQQNGLR